jgi:hypothetical protein
MIAENRASSGNLGESAGASGRGGTVECGCINTRGLPGFGMRYEGCDGSRIIGPGHIETFAERIDIGLACGSDEDWRSGSLVDEEVRKTGTSAIGAKTLGGDEISAISSGS